MRSLQPRMPDGRRRRLSAERRRGLYSLSGMSGNLRAEGDDHAGAAIFPGNRRGQLSDARPNLPFVMARGRALCYGDINAVFKTIARFYGSLFDAHAG